MFSKTLKRQNNKNFLSDLDPCPAQLGQQAQAGQIIDMVVSFLGVLVVKLTHITDNYKVHSIIYVKSQNRRVVHDNIIYEQTIFLFL